MLRGGVVGRRGTTRADALATLKVDADCGEALSAAIGVLGDP